tara:strand:- start:4351 stop:4560 length:210 start_codon:yes stop_codon:yes gene_type:complete
MREAEDAKIDRKRAVRGVIVRPRTVTVKQNDDPARSASWFPGCNAPNWLAFGGQRNASSAVGKHIARAR